MKRSKRLESSMQAIASAHRQGAVVEQSKQTANRHEKVKQTRNGNHLFSIFVGFYQYIRSLFARIQATIMNSRQSTEHHTPPAQMQFNCPKCWNQMVIDLKLYGFLFHAILFLAIFTLVSIGCGFIMTSCRMTDSSGTFRNEMISCNLGKSKRNYLLVSLIFVNCVTLILGIIDRFQASKMGYRINEWLFLICSVAGGVPSLWIVLLFYSAKKNFKFIYFLLLSSVFSALWVYGFILYFVKPQKNGYLPTSFFGAFKLF
jgi:uncharacterized membrane protein YsdA (DUF1294 family)